MYGNKNPFLSEKSLLFMMSGFWGRKKLFSLSCLCGDVEVIFSYK